VLLAFVLMGMLMLIICVATHFEITSFSRILILYFKDRLFNSF
jgi:hypothetical protein